MRRTPLKRRKPLTTRRTATSKRALKASARARKPLPARNAARRARLLERNFGERGAAVRDMPCLLAGRGCDGRVEAAHVRSRGAGGDRRELVPLCSGHHREQHCGVRTFCARYDINLRAEAERIAAELDARGVP
ncbi:hypothetical protein OV203_02590 [Nannocystis sp. ILAH1]|uniref:hypothetical protein n=1 Tax=Nannocystis sp. ILAH1 TaxID=2996789 RepID=UPI00226EA237|nr:hypothetical protein [Nannocystis sp. ILAH1]MCY0986000.1 hypothetical protein [Nannocystis sp. ILAH1]